jgi:GNAT superfamily N-acetyltransferase
MSRLEITVCPYENLAAIRVHPDIRRNLITFSQYTYLGAWIEAMLVGCVGWRIYRAKIVFGGDFVFPEYRRQGIYRRLCEERMSLVHTLGKPIIFHATQWSLPYHRQRGAIIVRIFKSGSALIRYEGISL